MTVIEERRPSARAQTALRRFAAGETSTAGSPSAHL
jgi:hypothetical protein